MNFQGLHRTIQFSISSLTSGERQRLNISHFSNFANRFLNFFSIFFKPKTHSGRPAKSFCVYQPRCVGSAQDAQQKHNISHFFNFANRFRNFFDFFKPGKPALKTNDPQKALCISARCLALERRNRDIIYHKTGTLQARFLIFLQKNRLFACFQCKTGKKIPRRPGDRVVLYIVYCTLGSQAISVSTS